MKKIIISGINLFEGGPLSVYKDCLDTIIEHEYDKEHKIIAFVHKKILFSEYPNTIQFIELPNSRKNYFWRLWYEYFYFKKFSKLERDIDIWISLHDITPNVVANNQFTYCHNPSPFLKPEIANFRYSPTNFLFSLFYKYLYKINIKKNKSIIVQQNWIREAFEKLYGVTNVIVARPNLVNVTIGPNINNNNDKFTFLFPAFPRFFKNFEVICEACKILENRGIYNFEICLTLNGKENNYSKAIYNKYKDLKCITWIGLQSRESVFSLYEKIDCMIFPSKLETWGLPISEFKETKKTIILSDLPYAHETIGNYDKLKFFDPSNFEELASYMISAIEGSLDYDKSVYNSPKEPFSNNWHELLIEIGFE
ncbi:glycosyltransferase [Fusibacter sp. 3D3]|uniref:glycosyltransferase n=1 Tax=Fusibacter sp. 3D3 TaxID=1048380 RepID=UPI000852E9C8|nr:glycosyltransferase [Fusibacter sp. 3D3]